MAPPMKNLLKQGKDNGRRIIAATWLACSEVKACYHTDLSHKPIFALPGSFGRMAHLPRQTRPVCVRRSRGCQVRTGAVMTISQQEEQGWMRIWAFHWKFIVIFVLFLASSPVVCAQDAGKYPPTIVFMTDFGVVDDSVAICRGVMYSVMPSVRIVDLSHEVMPFSILHGARYLYGATPYYPAGTVFVVVIDPGVGSTRKAVIIKSKRGQYFVLPDNGLMTLVAQRDGLDSAREITNTSWMIGKALSSTFHGRDIFSPAGAHLARGDDWTQVG